VQVVGPNAPDLTLVLDLPPEAGMARVASRGEAQTRFEAKGLDFHARLRAGFLQIAAAEPQRCVVIDATASPDEVTAAVWAAVQERLAP
jgi:dTMP kinase